MKLLVPIDGSGYALRAVEYAAKMAETLEDATVDFVYVIVYEANFMDSALMIEKAGELAAQEALDEAIADFAEYSTFPGRVF